MKRLDRKRVTTISLDELSDERLAEMAGPRGGSELIRRLINREWHRRQIERAKAEDAQEVKCEEA